MKILLRVESMTDESELIRVVPRGSAMSQDNHVSSV